jgi:membrane protein
VSSDDEPQLDKSMEREQAPRSRSEQAAPQVQSAKRSRVRAARDKGTATAARLKAGAAGDFWGRLTAADFMNSSMNLAALALLCVFPFLIVFAQLRGKSAADTIITLMGLNSKAAVDVKEFIAPTSAAVSTLSVFGAAWLVFGMIAVAATLRQWYERVFDQPPPTGALKTLVYNIIWAASFILLTWVQVTVGRHVSGRVLSYALQFVLLAVFIWWSAHFFLGGRPGWRQTLPVGIATGFCLTGLAVFSALFFSNSVISGVDDYGPVGVVSALMSFIIGIGVCIHLGAVFGRMWSEKHAPKPAQSQRSRREES